MHKKSKRKKKKQVPLPPQFAAAGVAGHGQGPLATGGRPLLLDFPLSSLSYRLASLPFLSAVSQQPHGGNSINSSRWPRFCCCACATVPSCTNRLYPPPHRHRRIVCFVCFVCQTSRLTTQCVFGKYIFIKFMWLLANNCFANSWEKERCDCLLSVCVFSGYRERCCVSLRPWFDVFVFHPLTLNVRGSVLSTCLLWLCDGTVFCVHC